MCPSRVAHWLRVRFLPRLGTCTRGSRPDWAPRKWFPAQTYCRAARYRSSGLVSRRCSWRLGYHHHPKQKNIVLQSGFMSLQDHFIHFELANQAGRPKWEDLKWKSHRHSQAELGLLKWSSSRVWTPTATAVKDQVITVHLKCNAHAMFWLFLENKKSI